MSGFAWLVGHIRVRDAATWAAYRAAVPATLTPWSAELIFRGQHFATLGGEHDAHDIVVIRFPDRDSLNAWFASPAYQALIPLREQAAEVVLLAYAGA